MQRSPLRQLLPPGTSVNEDLCISPCPPTYLPRYLNQIYLQQFLHRFPYPQSDNIYSTLILYLPIKSPPKKRS